MTRPPLRLADLDADVKGVERDLLDGTYIRVWRFWEWRRFMWRWVVVGPEPEYKELGSGSCATQRAALRAAAKVAVR